MLTFVTLFALSNYVM